MRSYSVSVISFTHLRHQKQLRLQTTTQAIKQGRCTHHFDEEEDGAAEAVVVEMAKGSRVMVPHFPDHIVADVVIPANSHIEQ